MDRELVHEWFRFANMDLDLAKHTLETMYPPPLEIICYHCQQAAEKFIKGVIISFDIEVEKTHDLSKLLNTLVPLTDIPDTFMESAERLTMFGIRVRYPNELPVDETQTKLAIVQAENIKNWAESLIKEQDK